MPWLIRKDIADAVTGNRMLDVLWARRDAANVFLPSAIAALPVTLPRWESFV